MTTTNEHPIMAHVDEYVRTLQWSDSATEDVKTFVIGNLRGFAAHLAAIESAAAAPTPSTVAEGVLKAAAGEIAERWFNDRLPERVKLHSLKINQLRELAEIVIAKHVVGPSEDAEQCFCGTELEAGLCPNGHDPVRKEELVDEVQHRMDQVVEAAVEWHQAGRECTEWFDKAEALGAAIDSLLELRDKPAVNQQSVGQRCVDECDIYDAVAAFRSEDGNCVLCGHLDLDADGLTCAAPVPICSDDSHGLRHCGCRCTFPSAPEAQSLGERIARDCGLGVEENIQKLAIDINSAITKALRLIRG